MSHFYSGNYVCTVKNVFRSMRTTTHVQVIFRSCSHLKAAVPSTSSGTYVIEPDGDGQFTCYCDMAIKDGIGVTGISHNRERREHVTGCDSPGCFKRNVIYSGATVAQLAGLSRVSSHCEQLVAFEYFYGVSFIEERYAWLVSRKGKPMYYWGGAAPGSGKCECGKRNTCAGGGGCSCKHDGPGGWRSDSGLLTDKFSLPVAQLRFGDVGSLLEEGYYTLGQFKCYGNAATIGKLHSVWYSFKLAKYNNVMNVINVFTFLHL